MSVNVEGDVSEHGGNAVEVDFEAVDFARNDEVLADAAHVGVQRVQDKAAEGSQHQRYSNYQGNDVNIDWFFELPFGVLGVAFHSVELFDVGFFVFEVDVVKIVTVKAVGFDILFVVFVFY